MQSYDSLCFVTCIFLFPGMFDGDVKIGRTERSNSLTKSTSSGYGTLSQPEEPGSDDVSTTLGPTDSVYLNAFVGPKKHRLVVCTNI